MYVIGSIVKQRMLANELLNVMGNVVLVGYLTFYKLVNTKHIPIVPYYRRNIFSQTSFILPLYVEDSLNTCWQNIKHERVIDNYEPYNNIHITVLLKICQELEL